MHTIVYKACTRPCVHYTAVYTGRVHCRKHDRVHGRLRAVYTGRLHVYASRTRLWTRPRKRPVQAVYGHVRPVHGRVKYTCTGRVRVHGRVYGRAHGPHTRLYGLCALPCRWAVKRVVYTVVYTAVAVYGPCTRRCTRLPCTRPVHGREHDHVHGAYTAVNSATRQCVHYTAVYTGRVH